MISLQNTDIIVESKSKENTLKIRKLAIIISVLCLFGQSLFAQESKTMDYSNASVSIKYYNRSIYYPGMNDDNP